MFTTSTISIAISAISVTISVTPTNTNQQVSCQYAYEPDKISRQYTCEPTLWQNSVLICLRNRPCASTILPHTIDKLIAPLCLLLRPNDHACMPMIYEPDNRRTDMPATQIDKTPCWYACGTNPITTMPLRLQPKKPIVPICIQSIN